MINYQLDDIDKSILNRIQHNFPVTSQPYLEIGDQLGISEDQVIERIKKYKALGLIRRLGGIFDSHKLGYTSTLCAMKVPEERVHDVADLINSYEGVTHNYLRNHTYNIWFTYIAPSKESLLSDLKSIKEKTKINDLINLPSTNSFKLNVNFYLKENSQ